jgi:hypothetical protein
MDLLPCDKYRFPTTARLVSDYGGSSEVALENKYAVDQDLAYGVSECRVIRPLGLLTPPT